MNPVSLISPLLALVFAPLLPGVINRVKAIFAGRTGQPLLQPYFDLAKLLRKGAVYSSTTTWIFRAGPVIGLAAVVAATALVPLGGIPAPLAFPGDPVLFIYLLGLMRFFTVVAALDTGSSFEGMGASREVTFSALAEPALFLGLAAVARQTSNLSVSGIMAGVTTELWIRSMPALTLVAAVLLVVLLAENSRIPVDDPNTHLELTMVHEVMVLDHSGPDLAFILYSAGLKLWLLGALLVGVVVPVRTGKVWLDMSAALGGMIAVAALIGVVESSMARLRLVRVPQLLVAAGALAAFALIMVLR